MAARAKKDALLDLGHETVPAAHGEAYREALILPVPMVKLQRAQVAVVAAVLAPSAAEFDEPSLVTLPSLAPITQEGRVPPLLPALRRFGTSTRRDRGGVVITERGALQAEPAPVERTQLPVNDLLPWKRTSARLARLQPDRTAHPYLW
jgi:hypothetical protein